MLKFFVHLMRDRRGNIAITLAITIVPLMAMVGASVDYGDTWRIKSLLQNAADSGALAGAALNSTSDSARIEIAERIFGENIAGLPAGISASPSVSEGSPSFSDNLSIAD